MKKSYSEVFISICCFILLLFVFALVTTLAIFQRNRIIKDDLRKYPLRDSSEILYSFDSSTIENGNLIINGWAIQPGLKYPYYNYGQDYHGEGVYNHFAFACIDMEEERITLFPTVLSREKNTERLPDDGMALVRIGGDGVLLHAGSFPAGCSPECNIQKLLYNTFPGSSNKIAPERQRILPPKSGNPLFSFPRPCGIIP